MDDGVQAAGKFDGVFPSQVRPFRTLEFFEFFVVFKMDSEAAGFFDEPVPVSLSRPACSFLFAIPVV